MKILSGFILLTVLLTDISLGQQTREKQFFNYDILNFYSDEGTNSRIDVYISVPLMNLEFKRSKSDKSSYISKLDINIDIFDDKGQKVFSNVSKEEVITKTVKQEYLSVSSQLFTKNIFLKPGKYKFDISLFELSTKKKYEESRSVDVEDFRANPLSISDVMIVSKMSLEGSKRTITPEPSRNTGGLDTFYLFCYVYNFSGDKQITVDISILNPESNEIFSKREMINSSGNLQNQIFVTVPANDFPYGKFTIDLKASGENITATSKSQFENYNPDLPFSTDNIDELIDQLQYAASDDEIKYIRKGKDEAEKLKRFLDFWKKQDPSPNTKKNEAMNDYYRRVIIANKLFSTKYTKGWRTDMGMVYIIFGEPSNVSRHPYEMDSKPYEIWDYYNLNRSFVFVDNSGFGDYKLVTPIWEIYRFNY
ncbi:MAG: GWxTD domain-containing protein [Ignavibacteria bacterium]|nr:GWxTD domain-containing protein [Ignavibacteria bacterium]